TATIFDTHFADYFLRVPYRSTIGVPEYKLENVPRARISGIDLVQDLRFRDNLLNVGWTYTYSDPVGEAGDSTTASARAKDWTPFRTDHGDHWLPYLARQAFSSYVRYDDQRKGLKASLDIRWTGGIRHYALSTRNAANQAPPSFRESSDFI